METSCPFSTHPHACLNLIVVSEPAHLFDYTKPHQITEDTIKWRMPWMFMCRPTGYTKARWT